MRNLNYFIKSKFISRNYYLAKYSYQIWRYIKLLGKLPIVIYQMGKVGSTSILYSLQQLNYNYQIYQIHYLSTKGIHKMEKMYWGKTPKLFRKSLLPETEHIFVSHFLQHQWNKRNGDRNWKFITLVRDPIARNVSEFFYSVDTTKVDPYILNFYELFQSQSINLSDLFERFQTRFHPDSDEFLLPLRWFEDEFNEVLNFDIYSHEFPRNRGYKIIKTNSSEILILKLEKLMSCYQEAFYEFLNIEDLRLITANYAAQKSYYPVYKEFIQHAKLSDDYINKMYNTKYMNHFYTETEIQDFKKKWQNKPDNLTNLN
jgi:hypothetical protein